MYIHLTLKGLTKAQRRRLDAAFTAACEARGVESVDQLPEAERVRISRETLELFQSELPQEVEVTAPAAAPAEEVKTFRWGAARRR